MDLDKTFILETVFYFCNISQSLWARNKVKYFLKISMDRAIRSTPYFSSQVLVDLRYETKHFVRFFFEHPLIAANLKRKQKEHLVNKDNLSKAHCETFSCIWSCYTYHLLDNHKLNNSTFLYSPIDFGNVRFHPIFVLCPPCS